VYVFIENIQNRIKQTDYVEETTLTSLRCRYPSINALFCVANQIEDKTRCVEHFILTKRRVFEY